MPSPWPAPWPASWNLNSSRSTDCPARPTGSRGHSLPGAHLPSLPRRGSPPCPSPGLAHSPPSLGPLDTGVGGGGGGRL